MKITKDPNTWHGEAFFAGLLRREHHVVQMIDAFPVRLARRAAGSRLLFCIEMELISSGTVQAACKGSQWPGWRDDQVIRQVGHLLGPLTIMHGMGTPHRDITPANVYIGNLCALKLGDFGIAKTALKRSGVVADAYAPAFRPRRLGRWWGPEDDVYQVGLLMMTLLSGEEKTNVVNKPDVNKLTDDRALRAVIKTAISVKSERYDDASRMRSALAALSS